MALFFDEAWFNQKLSQKNKSRSDLASALSLDDKIIAMIWKDQRALSPHEVAVAARFLNVPAEEITRRAGIATPRADEGGRAASGDILARLDQISARLDNIDRQLADLRNLIFARNIFPSQSS